MTNGVIARIALRYLVGALVMWGILSEDSADVLVTDPDLIILAGAAIGAATEGFYAYAKRRGWAT